MPLALAIALTHLGTRRRQTLVSVLGVALGVGFFVAMAALMQGFQRDFVERIVNATPHIVMKDEFRTPPLQPAEARFGEGALELRGVRPRDEIRGITRGLAIAGIIGGRDDMDVAPSLHGQIILHYGSADAAASLIGIDPARERAVTNLEEDLTHGTLDDLLTSPNGIILGSGVAERLGVGPDDAVTAVSPAGIVLRMKVVGIFHSGIVALDDSETYTLLKKAQVLQNRPNVVNRIRMRLDDPEDARRVAARIESRFLWRTESWQESNEGIMGIFVIQDTIMYSTVGAILIVACFGIFNVISTVIYEKTRDIAILKSIGFSRGDIRTIFVSEGLLVGGAGSVVGWGLGYIMVRTLESVPFDVEGIVEIQHLMLYHTPVHYILATFFSVGSAVLAAWLPARRAAELRPVDIIRGAA